MRRVFIVLALIATAFPISFTGSARGAIAPRASTSPAGQVKIVAVNAQQNRVVGLKLFIRLFELGRALRERPPAFDGGYPGAVAAPDVLIIQEMRPSNVEIFQRLLKQRYGFKYEIIGPSDSAAVIVINTERVQLQGEVTTWPDVCTDEGHPTDGRSSRNYEFAHLIENESGAAFVVAGMHAAKNYSSTGLQDCFIRNIAELRRQLADETAPTIIGGDFNRRPVADQYECDHNEESEPQPWWSMMVTPSDGGRAYLDTVRTWNRSHHIPMSEEWTHEQIDASVECNGSSDFRRSRIDYLFSAGAGIAEAHADHPGWAGRLAGSRNPDNYQYSDHRWVWGRFGVAGPAQPARPLGLPLSGGRVEVQWAPVDQAAEYVVYRALSGHAYRILKRVPGSETTYVDGDTVNDVTYRYAVAAVVDGGAQGIESRPVYALADSRGPHVTGVRPGSGAVGVPTSSNVEVFVDEVPSTSSVGPDTIRVYANGRRIRGTVVRVSSRRLSFKPSRLARGTRYRVVVRDLRDHLGNFGPRFQWSFTTVAPPPKKHKH
jgi:endonuclease/exonuclease/phosphatase family metal-dependent hydrolase